MKFIINKINFEKKYIVKILICIILFISIFGLIYAYNVENYQMLLISLCCTYVMCIIYSLFNFENKIFIVLFYFSLFVFILSRPVINVMKKIDWTSWGKESSKWAILAVGVSCIFILIGGIIGEKIKIKKTSRKKLKTNEFLNRNCIIISKISFWGYMVCFLVSISIEVIKLLKLYNVGYEEFFMNTVTIPSFIIFISELTYTFLVINLLTNPSKKKSYLVLVLYIILQIPILIIGKRGEFIFAILFFAIYLIYREHYDKNNWIGKKEKIICIIAIPVLIIFMGIINYTRSDKELPSYNPIDIGIDFFYRQGVTFNVLNIGYNNIDKLPNLNERNYTFGGIIDYVKYNKISTILFGTQPFKSGNNERKALESNSLAHALSYTARNKEYMEGHGIGSSYLLETYIDYGFAGIIIYSILLGIVLTNVYKILNKNNIFSIILLYSLPYIYEIPRSSATGCIDFVIQAHFWVPIIIVIIFTICYSKIVKRGKEDGNRVNFK